MKIITSCILGTVLCALALPAQAQGFAELGYQYIRAAAHQQKVDDVDVAIPSRTIGAIVLRGGYNLNEYLGLEGEFNLGITGDDVTAVVDGDDVSAEFELSTAIAGLGKLSLPVSDAFSVFGRLGYARVDAQTTATDLSVNSSSGYAYGVGASFDLGGYQLRGDWTRYDLGPDTWDGFSVSVVVSF